MLDVLDSSTRYWLKEVRESLDGSPSSVFSDADALKGCRLGRYEFGRLLGVGSAGVVFAARDGSGTKLAVKVMQKPVGHEPDNFSLFEREVGIGQAVNHPCVIRTVEAAEYGKARFLFMERVQGKTLRELLEVPLTVPVFLRLFRLLAEGLQAAHYEGVVHRDFKPENIMVSVDGDVKILDFGLARWTQGKSVTLTNQFKGTIDYCAPEQVSDSRNADHRCDQYAFGVICFEALTGELPFENSSPNAMVNLMNRLNNEPRKLREVAPHFSEETERVLLKILETEPSKRFGDVSLAFASLAQSLQS